MRSARRPRVSAWALVAVQAILLLLLAGLQFRWTGEISRAERQRMRASLELAADRFTEDFDRELTRAFLLFLMHGPAGDDGVRTVEAYLTQRLERWRETAPHPRLIRAVWWLGGDPDAALVRAAVSSSGEVEVAAAPALPRHLEPVRRRLEEAASQPRRRDPEPRAANPLVLAPEAAAVAIPRRARGVRPTRGAALPAVVIELDVEELRRSLFPSLGQRYLHTGQENGYAFAVVPSGGSGERIYPPADRGDPDPAAPPGDVEVPFFRLLPPEKARDLWFEARGDLLLAMEHGPGGLRMPQMRSGRRPLPPWLAAAAGSSGGWKLVVRHPEGSLEAAVRRIRGRNLTVSFGILLLLGLTMAMLVLSGRRAQRLAAQQVEFVAGITHELRTPVAAVASLGQNLEDGIVRGEEQVRRYGGLIRTEGARLEHLVDQVLELAGMLSGRRLGQLEPLAVGELIEGAVDDQRPLLEAAGCEVEVEVEAGLPRVRGDGGALSRALGNLIHNAVKYGGEPKWVSVRARRGAAAGTVVVEVEDRGPGIPRQDLPHLFQPFYRGRNATEERIPGSGLGLSLVRHIVEAHGGRIAVRPATGGGSRFEITLPVLPEEAGEDAIDDERPHPAGRG